jgi:pyruvate-ferredoxin/flavodoxin oxidoreductase
LFRFCHRYASFSYEGHPDAEFVVIAMCSGAVTLHEVANQLIKDGKKVGVLKVRLFRPWVPERFLAALPASVKKVAVMDRVKEVGALGEPLFVDVCATLHLGGLAHVSVIGGRYGLGGKDFTPGMAVAVFENLMSAKPKPDFTVGITDDVTHLSLPVKHEIDVLPAGTIQCLLYGLGSDGTVGANKTAIKMIATHTDSFAQGYFEYDSKKSGGLTISHLRFGPSVIHAPYLVKNADYIGIHKETYLQRLDIAKNLKNNGTLVINCQFGADKVEEMIPQRVKYQLATKKAKLYLINGAAVGQETGVGKRINMVMQTVFFKLSAVMQFEKAVKLLEKEVVKMYGSKGDDVVKKNVAAIQKSVERLVEIPIPAHWGKLAEVPHTAFSRLPSRKAAAGGRAFSTGRRSFSTGVQRPGDCGQKRSVSSTSSAPLEPVDTVRRFLPC